VPGLGIGRYADEDCRQESNANLIAYLFWHGPRHDRDGGNAGQGLVLTLAPPDEAGFRTRIYPKMIRTTEKTVFFRRPFFINGFKEPLPAGDYRVETDEERIEGLSFPAYRRVLTVMQLPAEPGRPGLTHSLTVDPRDLEAALERDQATADEPEDVECLRLSSTKLAETCGETAGRHALKRSETRARNRAISGGPDGKSLGPHAKTRSAPGFGKAFAIRRK